MKNKNIKVVSTALALTTVLGITAGIAINTNKQMETLGYTPVNAMSMDARVESKDDLTAVGAKPYNSVIGGTAMNEYATYAEFQNVDGSHEIRAWGNNHDGLLGNGDSNESTKLGWAEATKVDLDMTGKTLKFMESLNDTIFVVLEDNNGGADEVWAWGNNDKGQLFIDGEDFVSTPTRILEDVIPTWGSVVGVDASVGSTVIYFQGTEGQEFDPLNYNNEALYMYGAGDTSKDQDAKQGMFDEPLRFAGTHYIDSDANAGSYTMAYELNSDEVAVDDTRVISWGDNSNGILGTGDTAQPEEGYFSPTIDDEGLLISSGWVSEWYAPPFNFEGVTKLDYVAAGSDGFYYVAQSRTTGALYDNAYFSDYVFMSGSREVVDGVGVTSGIELIDEFYAETMPNIDGGWDYNQASTLYKYQGVIAGEDDFTLLVDKVQPSYYNEEWDEAEQYNGDAYTPFVIGDDKYSLPLEDGSYYYTEDDVLSEWPSPYFLDHTDRIETKYDFDESFYTYDPDSYLRDRQLADKTYLDGNLNTTIFTGSSSDVEQSRYIINGWGSNSNGVFDKYSDSNQSDGEYVYDASLYNYDKIKFEVLSDTVFSSSLEFTVDTNDAEMINPNSYEIEIMGNGENLTDNLELVSFNDGIATYKLSNLSRGTSYNFEYSFDGINFHEAFSATTSDAVAKPPVINNAYISPISLEGHDTSKFYDYIDSIDDVFGPYGRGYREFLNNSKFDILNYGGDLYNFEFSWDIEDVSQVGEEPTSIEKISLVSDIETADYGFFPPNTIFNDHVFFEIENPDWTGTTNLLDDYMDIVFDQDKSTIFQHEVGSVPDYKEQLIITPGSKLTNVRMEVYANQLEEPIIYELDDYEQKGLRQIDTIETPFTLVTDVDKTSLNLRIDTGLFSMLEYNFIGTEVEGWTDSAPTHVESDLEFTNFEIVSIDSRLTEDNYEVITDDFAEFGEITIKFTDLQPSMTIEDLVVKFEWKDNFGGGTYSQELDLVNDYGLVMKTDDWTKPAVPSVTLNTTSVNPTSAGFSWNILTPTPTDPQQSIAQINKVTLSDRKHGISYDVTDKTSSDVELHSGNYTVEDLTPETDYAFELIVNYSDTGGSNASTKESNIVEFTTGDYLDALQPTIKLEEGTPGYDSFTVDYTITLPDPEANPENRPTELYSVELYINDETTPAVVSEEGDLSDTNTDGEITGTLTASGLDPETSYDWHIEVVSNAERVVGATHTITTEMLAKPNAPRIVTGSTSLTATDDYNVFKFDYTLDIDEEVAGQSPAFIDSVEFVYKGEVIGQQPFKNGNPSSQNGQPIPDGGFVGSFDVTGIDWNIDVTDAVLRVGYSGSSEGQNYSVDLNIDSLSSPSLNTEDVQPNIKRAQVATNGGFKQISSTEAVISYSVETPAVTLGTAAVRIDEIRIVDGTEVLARTTEHSGNILLTNLETGTLYSTLKLEVDYTYVRPSYDNNAGDDLGYESGTVSQNVTPFKTLDEGEFSLSGNVQYVGYNEGNLEGVLTVFDSSNAFFNEHENFRVSVKEGTGESAVRVEKVVKLTKVESTKNDKAESGIETTEYKIVINDIQEGVQYTSWKYTMSTATTPEDSEWISFKIEDPITGNEFNKFYMPPNITNHNMIYIILDVILLVSALGLIVAVVNKATNKDDEDEDDEEEVVVKKKTKAVKGGNNE